MRRPESSSVFLRFKGKKYQDDHDPRMRPAAAAFFIASVILHGVTFFFMLPSFAYLESDGSAASRHAPRKKPPTIEVRTVARELKSIAAIEAVENPAKGTDPGADSMPSNLLDAIKDPASSNIYHVTSELTKRPELIGENPNDDVISLENNATGNVLLKLNIDRLGKVNSVSVIRSTLDRATEGRIALRFYRASYRPGEINGSPVASQMIVRVETQGL